MSGGRGRGGVGGWEGAWAIRLTKRFNMDFFVLLLLHVIPAALTF